MGHRGPRRAPAAFTALLLVLVLGSGCSSDPDEQAAFCDRLSEATSSTGAESLFSPFDPERVSETAQELNELADLAPESLAPTMTDLADLFAEIERTDARDLPALLIENETEIQQMSDELTTFSVDECGLFLQRAPVPTPTSAPLVLAE